MHVSTPVLAVLLIGLVYFLGIRSERTGFVREVLDPGIKRITQPVLNAFRGRPPTVMQLHLALSDTTLKRLAARYASARPAGWLVRGGSSAIGRCAWDERATDAFIGLRPGPFDAREEKRWPFQVLMQQADTLLHIQSFDLIPVIDDAPLRTSLLARALSDQGLPSLEISLVELKLNDRDLGLYSAEERVDAATLERWARGPGPVLRFDDELRTAVEGTKLRSALRSDPLPQEDWMAAPIMASQGDVQRTAPGAARRYRRAVQQLDDFRSGSLPAAEVFDVRATARLFALCDLLGGQDATNWWNLRFLVDSLSGALIALPQRGGSFTPITSITALLSGSAIRSPSINTTFHERLFGDALFYRSYIACLDSFTANGWLEGLLRRLSPEYAIEQRIVLSAYPQSQPDASVFAHNRDVIRRTLRPPDLVLAYTQEDPTADASPERELAIANIHALPVEVTAFIAGTDTLELPAPIVLWPRQADKPLIYVPASIRPPRGYQGSITLLVHVIGTHETRGVHVRTWSTFTAN